MLVKNLIGFQKSHEMFTIRGILASQKFGRTRIFKDCSGGKIMKKKLFMLVFFALAGVTAHAGCLDVLEFCYDHGGSDLLCNHFYTACLAP